MPSRSGSELSVDNIRHMATGVLDSGTRKHKFAQTRWFLETGIVKAHARLRKGERGGAPDAISMMDCEMMDCELAAIEIFGEVADMVMPVNEEGLLAIGEAKRVWYQPRARRYTEAARARGNTGESAGRNWRQEHRNEFIEMMTRELYRMIYFSDGDLVPSG